MKRYAMRLRWAAAGLLLLAAVSNAYARTILDGDGEKQALAFARIYTTFCIKHIIELQRFSDQMSLAPAHKIYLSLSTAASDSAPVQAVATVALADQ